MQVMGFLARGTSSLIPAKPKGEEGGFNARNTAVTQTTCGSKGHDAAAAGIALPLWVVSGSTQDPAQLWKAGNPDDMGEGRADLASSSATAGCCQLADLCTTAAALAGNKLR